jgi:ATP-dependent DNA helicase RecG
VTSTPEQIAQWLTEPEGVRLEFKTAASQFKYDKLAEYCAALANEGGGRIILGVSDRRPRRVIGTQAFDEPGRTEAGLYRDLHHRVPIEETRFEGKRILIVHVPPRLPGQAWEYRGRYLRRAGDDLVSIPSDELRAILSETNPDFSAQPTAATIADLSQGAISEFRRRWERKSGNPRIGHLGDQQLLDDAELLQDGHINVAGLVLFATHRTLGRFLPQVELVFEYRSSEASGPAQDRAEFREGFFLWQNAIWSLINLRNDKQSYQEGLFRYDINTFDETAVREALLNAVAHRDYRLGGSIFVRQYARRLEIVSPGGFPPGITPDNIIDQQNPRNRRLAEVLGKCGLIERSGQGLNLMVESAVRHSKPLPDFAGSSSHEVRLSIRGNVQDPAFIRFLEKIGEETLSAFSTHDFLVLDTLRRGQAVPPNLQARLPGLIESGVVERHGRGRGVRYLLSRGLYAALDRRGTYTRERGLDRQTNKELLCKHIRENDAEGSPWRDLCQVLPALSRSQLQALLHELRGEGRIRVAGTRRWARWHVGPGMSKPEDPA